MAMRRDKMTILEPIYCETYSQWNALAEKFEWLKSTPELQKDKRIAQTNMSLTYQPKKYGHKSSKNAKTQKMCKEKLTQLLIARPDDIENI